MKPVKVEDAKLFGSYPITFTRILPEEKVVDEYLENDLKFLCDRCRTHLDLVNEIVQEYEESFIIDSDGELVHIEEDDEGNIHVKDAIDVVTTNNLVYVIYTLDEVDSPDFIFCFCNEESQLDTIINGLNSTYRNKKGEKIEVIGYFS